WGGCWLLLSARALRLRVDPRKRQLPAGSAERLAPRRKPELGAALRADVLAYRYYPYVLRLGRPLRERRGATHAPGWQTRSAILSMRTSGRKVNKGHPSRSGR